MYWSMADLADANEVLDALEEAEAIANGPA